MVYFDTYLPIYTWPLLVLIFLAILGAEIWVGKSRQNTDKKRQVLRALLITYAAAILFSTLLFRKPMSTHKAKPIPFWSWYEVLVHHSGKLLKEILLNILLFVPVGAIIRVLYDMRTGTVISSEMEHGSGMKNSPKTTLPPKIMFSLKTTLLSGAAFWEKITLRPIHVFLIGFLFSAAIEICQFITCRGYFEWDDMLHNGCGCLIGWWVGGVIEKMSRK